MATQGGIQVIAIEEHYLDAEVDGLMGDGHNPFRDRRTSWNAASTVTVSRAPWYTG